MSLLFLKYRLARAVGCEEVGTGGRQDSMYLCQPSVGGASGSMHALHAVAKAKTFRVGRGNVHQVLSKTSS